MCIIVIEYSFCVCEECVQEVCISYLFFVCEECVSQYVWSVHSFRKRVGIVDFFLYVRSVYLSMGRAYIV